MINFEEFKEDIQVGEYVRISSLDGEFIGKVLRIRSTSVKIENNSAEDVIPFDRITQYSKIKDASSVTLARSAEKVSAVRSTTFPFANLCQDSYRLVQQASVRIPTTDDLKRRAKQARKSGTYDGANELNAILDSFAHAKKIHEDQPETDRMHDILARTRRMVQDNPSDTFAVLLLACLLHHNHDEKAAAHYAEAHEYEAAAALTPDSSPEKLSYAAAAVSAHGSLPGLWSIHALSPTGQWAVYEMVLKRLADFPEDVRKTILAFVAACLSKANITPSFPDTGTLYTERNISYLRTVLKEHAEDHIVLDALLQMEKEQKEKKKQTKESAPSELIGSIIQYHPDKGYGFITGAQGTTFFHITQVNDGRLRYLLSHEKYTGRKVKFRLGLNTKREKSICANNIQMAEEDVHKEQEATRQEGVLLNYDRFEHIGRIQAADHTNHTFWVQNIIDPYLKAYIESIDIEGQDWPVEFSLKPHKGKFHADQIRSLQDFPQEFYEEWKRSTIISKKDLEKWAAYQARGEVSEPEEEWEDGIYIPLQPYQKSLFEKKVSLVATTHAVKPKRPPIKNLGANKFAEISVAPEPTSQNFYARAHKLWLTANRDQAEALYIEAIKHNDHLPSAIGDLLSLYIKRGNETGDYSDAFSLMENHGREHLERDKYLNNMITLYSASRTDPERLIDYYRDAIDETVLPNRKLHYIRQMAVQEQNIGKYQDSLDSCDIWEQVAAQYALQPSDSDRRYMEHLRCISIYGLGRKDEAKKMAESLLSFFPNNDSLQQIISGNFDATAGTAKKLPANVPAFDHLPLFLQNMLDDVSLDRMKKTTYITDNGIKEKVTNKDLTTEYSTIMFAMAGVSNAERARQRLLVAKYIKNCLAFWPTVHSEPPPSVFTEERMLENIRESLHLRISAELGSFEKHFSTMRFYYLLMLEILLRKEKLDRDMIDTVIVRYIQLSFCSVENLTTSLEKNLKLDDLFLLERETEFQPDDFRNAFLQLAQFLQEAPVDLRESLGRLATWLKVNRIFEPSTLFDMPEDDVKGAEILREIVDNYAQESARLSNMFAKNTMNFSSSVWLKDLIVLLENLITGHQDRQYNKKLIRLLKMMQDLYQKNDFDSRIQILDNIRSQAMDLNEEIEKFPTQFSYTELLPILGKLREWVNAEHRNQYKLAPRPDIVKQEANKGDQHVVVVLRISNQMGCQRADNPMLRIEVLTEHVTLESTPILEPVSSSPQDHPLRFLLEAESGDHIDTLDLKVFLKYEYRCIDDDNTEHDMARREETLERSFSIALNDAAFEEIPNPFDGLTQGGAVLNKDMMFGRDKDIEQVLEKVSDSDHHLIPGRSIALFGQKRSGKTTLLHFVKERIRQNFEPDAICIELGSVGSFVNDHTFLRSLLAKIASELENSLYDNEELKKLAEEDGLTEISDIILSDENYHHIFDRFMQRYLKVMKKWRPHSQLVFFLDEFTYLYNYIRKGSVSPDVLQYWKAFMETYRCSSIIVGQDSMAQLHKDYPNELGTIQMQRVHYLDFDATKDMLFRPLQKAAPRVQIEPEAYTRLFEYSAGSAYWHMILCSRLVAFLNQNTLYTVTAPVVDNMVQQELESGDIITQQLFQPLYNDSQCTDDNNREQQNIRLLAAIAHAAQPASPYVQISDIKVTGITPEEKKSLLDALVQRKVLDCREEKYKIFVELFRRWLNKYFGGE